MSCDPSNPIKGGACPLQNTGPPDVYLSLRDGIKNPQQLGSSTKGDYNTIGKNMAALSYYVQTLGEGPQYNGYGIRQAYNTGIQCGNLPGQYAHRLADGTNVGVGGYGIVPRLIGSLNALNPTDLVDSAKTSTQCTMMLVHENTPNEREAIRTRGTDGVPRSNKIQVSNSKGVNYRRMNQLCASGQLRDCKRYPVQNVDISAGSKEGFRGRRGGHRGGYRSWRRGNRGYGRGWRYPYWGGWYSTPVVYVDPRPETVYVREIVENKPAEEEPSSVNGTTVLLILASVLFAGAIFAMRR